jgi:hypothetical protein
MKDWWRTVPIVAKVFIGIAILFSLTVFVLANYPFSEFQIRKSPSMIFGLIAFICVGILVSIGWTCAHWFMLAWASKRFPSTALLTVVGLLMLGADAYIRITSVFFAKSSTAPVAVMFIPIYVGGIAIPIYCLLGWLFSKSGTA